MVSACSKDAPAPPPPPPVTVDAAVVAPPTDAAESANKITITVAKPKAPGSGFAKRCAIAGAPLATTCTGGSKGIAIDKAGLVYVANEKHLHRYKLVEACRLEPVGEPIELPPDNPRPQRIDGPVYMRSGGAAWQPLAAKGAVYVHDFLGGLFRVERDAVTPACTELFGFRSIVHVRGKFLGKRNGVEELALGKRGKCTAKLHGKEKHRFELFAARDKLYTGFSELFGESGRIDLGKTRLCALTAMTACGDGACLLDHNCPKLVQLGPDDAVLRELDADKLFDTRPYSLDDAVATADGHVLLYARHRDTVDAKATCEAAIYYVPAAAFAR